MTPQCLSPLTIQNNTIKCGGGGGSSSSTSWRLAQARATHRTICTLLLASHTALAAQLETIMAILPPWVASRDNPGASTTPPTPQPTRLKVDNLSEVAKVRILAGLLHNGPWHLSGRVNAPPKLYAY